VPGDSWDKKESADVKVATYDGESPTIGLRGVYSQDRELYYGQSATYHELLYVIRGASGAPEQIERFLFRQQKPLSIIEAALQPQAAFNPMKDAECFIKVTGDLDGQDTCDGAVTCKLFRNLSIYAETESDTCSWPRISSFAMRVSSDGDSAEIPEPGTDNWTSLQRISLPGVTGQIVQISEREERFSEVVGHLADGRLAVAGKKHKTDLIEAALFDVAGDTEPKLMPLSETTGSKPFGSASAGGDLLVLTAKGIYLLQPSGAWVLLAMPDGMTAMPDPAKVTRVETASGPDLAAFRIVVKDAGIESQRLLVFKSDDKKLTLLPMENPVSPEPVGGYAVMIVNGQVWLFNPDTPALAHRFDFTDGKWHTLSPVIPAADTLRTSRRYQLTPSNPGFVLSTWYEKDFALLPSFSGADDAAVRRRVYRHYYYNERGEYTDRFVDTIAPPEALRFHGTRLYAERVLGLGFGSEDKIMDYGYIYDFAEQRGYMFKDALSMDLNAPDWLTWFGSLSVIGTQVAFIGGCDQPVNRVCLPMSHVSRVIDLPPEAGR
jgi:hypothetical protein